MDEGDTNKQLHEQNELLKGSSLNYVGEFRQRIWPQFLCDSVVGSVNHVSPQRNRDTENFQFKLTHTKHP